MAIIPDWATGVIFVPKSDTVLTGTDPISGREVRSFDTDLFHVNLRIAEDSIEGRAWPRTHDYNPLLTISGTPLAPQFILINSYQVEFEEVSISYRVVFTSTNNNIAELSVINNVSIQPGNSAGLQLVSTGSGLSTEEQNQLKQIWQEANCDASSPVTRTPASTTFDDVTIEHTGDPKTSITSTKL